MEEIKMPKGFVEVRKEYLGDRKAEVKALRILHEWKPEKKPEQLPKAVNEK